MNNIKTITSAVTLGYQQAVAQSLAQTDRFIQVDVSGLDQAMESAKDSFKASALSVVNKFVCPVLGIICFFFLVWSIFKAVTTYNDDPQGGAFRGWIISIIISGAGGTLLMAASIYTWLIG